MTDEPEHTLKDDFKKMVYISAYICYWNTVGYANKDFIEDYDDIFDIEKYDILVVDDGLNLELI